VDEDLWNAWRKKRQHEWLGVKYDLSDHTICAKEKILVKLRKSWDRRAGWSNRQAAAHYALLFYTSRILNLNVSRYYFAMRAFRDLSRLLQEGESFAVWDEPCSLHGTPAMLRDLGNWTHDALANTPRRFDNETEDPTNDVIFVDASDWGWGAVKVCHKTGTFETIARRWSNNLRATGRTKRSTQAEPLAVDQAVRHFFPSKTELPQGITVITDSTTAKAAHNSGKAADYFINGAVDRLRSHIGDTKIFVHHVAGRLNPADPLSRGESLSTCYGELAALASGVMGLSEPST